MILVGRTGLELVLRGDAELEVTRVASTFDAIGELSSPIDEESPHDAVVIVGADADPALRDPGGAGDGAEGGGGSGAGMQEAEEFVRGLRRVQPLVRVLRVAEAGMSGVPYDGVVSPRADAAEARRAIRGIGGGGATGRDGARERDEPEVGPGVSLGLDGAAGPHGAAGHSVAAHGATTAGESKAKASHAGGEAAMDVSGDAAGDAALVRAVLLGRDVVAVALEIARDRTGDATLALTSSDSVRAARSAEVNDGVSVVGHLGGARVDGATLRSLAAWLSGWLKLSRQQGELRRAAFTDPLTGAWNRRYFERFLGAAIEQSARQRRQLTVLMFDIDNFKQFNERFGHSAADEVLVDVVRLLTSVIRPSDRVCRIGGDEFAVVFYEPAGPRNPGSKHPTSVQDIAARFQEQIRQKRFPKLGLDAPGTLTISGGMSTFPWDGRTVEELVRHADLLALESKRQGKNAITLGPGGA